MWKCPKCQEELEDQFDSCWRCTTPRPDNGVASPPESRPAAFGPPPTPAGLGSQAPATASCRAQPENCSRIGITGTMKKCAVLGLIVVGIAIGFALVKNRWFKDRDPDQIVRITHTSLSDAVLLVDYTINYDHLCKAAARRCQPYQYKGEEVSVRSTGYDITVGLFPQKIYRGMKASRAWDDRGRFPLLTDSGADVRAWDVEDREHLHILTDVCGMMYIRRELDLGDVPVYSFRFSVAPSARGVTNYHAAVFIPVFESRYLAGRYQLVVEARNHETLSLRGKFFGAYFATLGWKDLTTKIPDQPAPATYHWKQKRQQIKAESGGTLSIDKLVTVQIPPNALLEDCEVRVDVLVARGLAMTCLITKDILNLPEELRLNSGKAVQVRLNYGDLGAWEDLTMVSREGGGHISAGLPGVAVNKEEKTVTFEAFHRTSSLTTPEPLGATGKVQREEVQFEAMSPAYQLVVNAKRP